MARTEDPRVVRYQQLIAKNLAAARKHRGLHQEQLARQAEVPVNMYARWERGEAWMSAGHLKVLADVLEFPLEQLFDEHPTWLKKSLRKPH